jgi:hypothetical protein
MWFDDCQSAFVELKRRLTSALILAFPNFNSQFLLMCDANKFCIAAVLSQVQNGVERVIAYASRGTNPHKRNYYSLELECLSAYFFVKTFRPYLLYQVFGLITNHSALQWLKTMKKGNTRLLRWALKLEEYTYVVLHRPGTEHGNADGLTRAYPPSINLIVSTSTPLIRPFFTEDTFVAALFVETVKEIDTVSNTVNSAVSGKSEYVDPNSHFVIENVGSDVSESLLDRIRRLQCENSECKELRDYLSVRILPTSPDRAKTIGKRAKLFAMVDDTLVFTNSKTERVHFRVVLPKVMRMSVMYMFHDYPLYGAHMGMTKVYDKIRG